MKLKFLLKILFFSLLLIETSYAYIDPGTGSLILQILGSIFIGIVVFFKTIKMQIENILSKLFKKQKIKK